MKQRKYLLLANGAMVLARGYGRTANTNGRGGSWSAVMIRSPIPANAQLDVQQATRPPAGQTGRQMALLSAGTRGTYSAAGQRACATINDWVRHHPTMTRPSTSTPRFTLPRIRCSCDPISTAAIASIPTARATAP